MLSNSDSFLLLSLFLSNCDTMRLIEFLFKFVSHLEMQEIVSFQAWITLALKTSKVGSGSGFYRELICILSLRMSERVCGCEPEKFGVSWCNVFLVSSVCTDSGCGSDSALILVWTFRSGRGSLNLI